jgi:integrase
MFFVQILCKWLFLNQHKRQNFMANIKNASASIVLDKRRARKDSTYPVKLRVYHKVSQKTKMYPLELSYSEQEFKSIWLSQKVRMEKRQENQFLKGFEVKANDVISSMSAFGFEEFERKMFRKASDGSNIKYHYQERLKELRAGNQLSTADMYRNSYNSLEDYASHKGKRMETLSFQDIDRKWLEGYQRYFEGKGRSQTTISMYLRSLRAIFNRARELKDIEADVYPFGKRKFVIPKERKVKKAISKHLLKAMYHTSPKTKQQELAKDFWFLSYYSAGMNMKDILNLKYKDIQDGRFLFYRSKTVRTSKGNLRKVSFPINSYARSIIEKYGTKGDLDSYVFPELVDSYGEEEKRRRIKNFTRKINQHFKKLCADNGLPVVSTYAARHTFATLSITEQKIEVALLQEILGHSDIKTTQNYLAGFDDSVKKELADGLMNMVR